MGKTHEEQEAEEAQRQADRVAEAEEHQRRTTKGGAELPDVGSSAGPKTDETDKD